MIQTWLGAKVRESAGNAAPAPLAMLAGLWDKARALDADQSEFNLDRRQTLVMILDAIRDLDKSPAPQ
jgi:hypothetical protein